ncbi:MAG TPA: hypothetical protein VLV54_13575 [Thermoanaerobaculia bacterium]|nr:hypothetical protein [Thermoanaerobaculia bacterium]
MVLSRGFSRPPVFYRAILAGACALAVLAVPASAQPSPNLLSWLHALAANEPAETPVLAAGSVTPPVIPPGSIIGEVRVVNHNSTCIS